MKKTCVILPTYNEKENIEPILKSIFKVAPNVSVMVVDDNSPDGTAGIVELLKNQYPNLSLMRRARKEGLGRAYIDAFKKVLSEGAVEKIIMMDADFSHSPSYLPKMIEESENYDVVVGSRYVEGGKTVGWELWRRLLSRGGNFYARIITGMPIRDLTGGFNLINKNFLEKINLEDFDASGYAFMMELKDVLFRGGARFKEIPIVFKNRVGGESKISNHIIKEGVMAPWRMRLKK
jgi:dolichol-phosphate mannosyltransferase